MTLASALVADFQSEADKTRRVLESVPDKDLGWRPHEKSMTLGELAGHLAENPAWVGSMLESDLDFESAIDSYKPFVPRTRAELLATFDRNVASVPQALGGRDDASMLSTWTMRNGAKVLMEAPRHAAIRGTAINHWIHHRGQMTVYLRLLGVTVPQTYGPTADVPAFG